MLIITLDGTSILINGATLEGCPINGLQMGGDQRCPYGYRFYYYHVIQWAGVNPAPTDYKICLSPIAGDF